MNPNCARTYATFRLGSDLLVPAEVTRRLKIDPSDAHSKGEARTSRTTGRTNYWKSGFWSVSTDASVKSTDLEQHIQYLLGRLLPRAAEVAAIVREYGAQADVFCFWASATGHGGPTISWRTMKQLGELNIDLGIDFYGVRE